MSVYKMSSFFPGFTTFSCISYQLESSPIQIQIQIQTHVGQLALRVPPRIPDIPGNMMFISLFFYCGDHGSVSLIFEKVLFAAQHVQKKSYKLDIFSRTDKFGFPRVQIATSLGHAQSTSLSSSHCRALTKKNSSYQVLIWCSRSGRKKEKRKQKVTSHRLTVYLPRGFMSSWVHGSERKKK